MSSLKIKPKKKVKRRGDHLIKTIGRTTLTYQRWPAGRFRLVAVATPGQSYTASYSAGDRYALLKGEINGEPVQHAILRNRVRGGPLVAVRSDNGGLWWFLDPDNEEAAYISISQTGIKNAALIAASVTHEIDRELAEFPGVSQQACRDADIAEFHENSRWRELRDFEFRIADAPQITGTGSRAENDFRHNHTNYDDMLQAAGGLLWPEQYAVVRKGVDRIVAGTLKEIAR